MAVKAILWRFSSTPSKANLFLLRHEFQVPTNKAKDCIPTTLVPPSDVFGNNQNNPILQFSIEKTLPSSRLYNQYPKITNSLAIARHMQMSFSSFPTSRACIRRSHPTPKTLTVCWELLFTQDLYECSYSPRSFPWPDFLPNLVWLLEVTVSKITVGRFNRESAIIRKSPGHYQVGHLYLGVTLHGF